MKLRAFDNTGVISSELDYSSVEIIRDATAARIGSIFEVHIERQRDHSQRRIFAAWIDREVLR